MASQAGAPPHTRRPRTWIGEEEPAGWSLAAVCDGRWRASSASTSPSPASRRLSRCRGTPANDAVRADGRRGLIEDRRRFECVHGIGVDEHVWRHTRRGDTYVTVIIGLISIRDGTGPSRLLDMVEGRSEQVFKTWLAARREA